ncbi:uncharacterized protein LOC119740394 [Patiria miniata]|uniref:Uncharacterized protein n=1 Tax=Patiria miniata TaxID=46514 RepID=A0A914B5U3_PATMI|nr:uncharacterized protein LOC119740394 [Patiria miniata]
MREGTRVDLNRCTAARLSAVSGIAPDTAGRIITYRRRRKRLGSVRDVLDVRGVTEQDLEMLRLTTQVRRLLTSPQATKAAKPRQSVRSVTSPKQSQGGTTGRKQKPMTSKKGTQTLETGDSRRKRVEAASVKRSKTKTLPVKRTAASQRSKRQKIVKSSRRKSDGRRTQKSEKSHQVSVGLMTSSKKRNSPTTGLLICREADRLKASEGLDYVDIYGSPRPLLTVSGPREGVQLARAQINNCAVTVHLTERAPLMSPMVTVNIPSSLLDGSPGLMFFSEDKGASLPSTDAKDASMPRQGGGSVQSGPTVTVENKDQNNSNNLAQEKGADEVQKASPLKILAEDQQEGYMAGSETDHTTPSVTQNQAPPEGQTPISLTVGNDSNLAASKSTGRRRKTRSQKKTAEKVQLWLENSSCSSSYFNPEKAGVVGNLFDGEKRQQDEDFLMSGIAPLLLTTPVDDQSEKAARQSLIGEPRPGCKRDLEQELETAETPLTPAADGAAGKTDRSVQTPSCSCRSCRRKRRARRRSAEAAGERRDQPGSGANFTPVTSPAEELSAAWCLLL